MFNQTITLIGMALMACQYVLLGILLFQLFLGLLPSVEQDM